MSIPTPTHLYPFTSDLNDTIGTAHLSSSGTPTITHSESEGMALDKIGQKINYVSALLGDIGMDSGKSWSLSWWYRIAPNVTWNNKMFLGTKDYGSNYGLSLWVRNPSKMRYGFYANDVDLNVSFNTVYTNVTTNQWVHFVIVYDNDNELGAGNYRKTAYVDGIELTTDGTDQDVHNAWAGNNTTHELDIGGAGQQAYTINGTQYWLNLAIFNKPLSLTEVQTIYLKGKTFSFPPIYIPRPISSISGTGVSCGTTSERDNLTYVEVGDVFYNTETSELQIYKNSVWRSLSHKIANDRNAFKITSGDSVPTLDSNSKEGNIYYNTNTGNLRIREESAWQVTSKQSITDRAEFKTLYGASTPSVNTIQNVFYNTDTKKLQYLKNDAWRTVAEEEVADDTFNVGVDSYKFSLNNAVQPELNLYRGSEYVFNQSSADNSGQRLFVSNDLSGRVVSAAAKYPKTALTSLNDNNYNVTSSSTHYSAANIWTGFDYVTNPTPKTLYENTYTINTGPLTISLNGVSGAITPVNGWAKEFPILEISANDPNFFNTICEVSWSQSTEQNQHGGYYIQHDGIPQNAQTTAPGPMWWWGSWASGTWRYNSYDGNTNVSTSSSYKLNNTVKFEFINNTSWKLTTNASGSTTAYTYTNSGFQGNVKIMYAFYEGLTSLHELIVKRQDTGTLHWWVGDSASGRDYDSNGDYIGNQSSFQTVGGEWIQIHFKNEIFILGSIKLYERPTTTEQATINQHLFAAKLPKDGIIFGSNDGSNWSQLCVFSNNDPSPRTININASTGYSYYTLLVTKTGGGAYGGNVNIAEIEFYSDSRLISSENTTGFTSTGTLGTDLVSTWTIPTDASDTMYYASDGSANAGGKINITNVPAQEKTYAVDVSLVQSQSGGTVVGLAGAGGLYTVGGSEYSSNPATIQINSGSHIFDGYYHSSSGWSPTNSSSFTAHQIWGGAMENIINNTIDSTGNTILSNAPEGGTIDQNTAEFSVIITFPVSVVINEYKMWHRGGGSPSQPKAWTLRATDNLVGYEQNNDLTYTQLDDRDSITGWVGPGGGTPDVNNANSYTFANTSAYKTYIINFTESNRTTHIALNELAYYGYVPSLENAFTLGGLAQPTLNLYRDSVYKFDQSDPDNVGQRLFVSNDLTLTENTAGVTSAGTLGTDLITTWRVPTDASDTMYYASDGSANMGGTISITDAPTKTTRVTTIASSAGSNGGGDTYTKYAVDVSLNRFTIGGHLQPTLNLYKDSIYKFDQSDPDNVGQRLFVSNDLSGQGADSETAGTLVAGGWATDTYAVSGGITSSSSLSNRIPAYAFDDNGSNDKYWHPNVVSGAWISVQFINPVKITKYIIMHNDPFRTFRNWELRGVNEGITYNKDDSNTYNVVDNRENQGPWNNNLPAGREWYEYRRSSDVYPLTNSAYDANAADEGWSNIAYPGIGLQFNISNPGIYKQYVIHVISGNDSDIRTQQILYFSPSSTISENTTGVTSTGTLGTDLITTWRVPTDASDTMYYASDGSANAGGKINVEVTPYEEKTYAVDVSPNAFTLGGLAQPTLNLYRDSVYKFDQSDASNVGQRLFVSNEAVIGGTNASTQFPKVNLTSATSADCVVTASSSPYSGDPKWRAFDGTTATFWQCQQNTYTNGVANTGANNSSFEGIYGEWIQIHFQVESFVLKELKVGAWGGHGGPDEGYVFGSLDGSSWTQLTNFTGITISGAYQHNGYKTIDISAPKAYSYYVLLTTLISANETELNITEIQLHSWDPQRTILVENTAGVTSTGTLGTDLVTRWRVPTDASSRMYYASDGDANAGGKINITDIPTQTGITTECLSVESVVNVVTSGGNKYRFNNDTTYDSTKIYGLGSRTYTFKSVPSLHPIAILNAGKTMDISYSGVIANESNMSVTGTENDGTYKFYHGDVNVDVLGDFGSVSIYCLHHGYMGGKNLLRYSELCGPPFNVDINGTKISSYDDYTVHEFKYDPNNSTSGETIYTITIKETITADFLLIAGGGGGGKPGAMAWEAGGGGAGELIYQTNIVFQVGTYIFKVGDGGEQRVTLSNTEGPMGYNSSIIGNGLDNTYNSLISGYIAKGGQSGSIQGQISYNTYTPKGGSGGGNSFQDYTYRSTPVSGTITVYSDYEAFNPSTTADEVGYFGNKGGVQDSGSNRAGGGGGAGGAGGGNSGGNSKSYSIRDGSTQVPYAGGGGGSGGGGGIGGDGGGNAGQDSSNRPGGAADSHTGSGGGGGYQDGDGGKGGSGLIIIRYKI